MERPGRKPAWEGDRRLLDSKKKVSRQRISLSKSLDIQEVREMGRKDEGLSKGFPDLWMGMIVEVFQQEGKE